MFCMTFGDFFGENLGKLEKTTKIASEVGVGVVFHTVMEARSNAGLDPGLHGREPHIGPVGRGLRVFRDAGGPDP